MVWCSCVLDMVFCTTFAKKLCWPLIPCLPPTTCLKYVVGGKQGNAPCKWLLLQQIVSNCGHIVQCCDDGSENGYRRGLAGTSTDKKHWSVDGM